PDLRRAAGRLRAPRERRDRAVVRSRSSAYAPLCRRRHLMPLRVLVVLLLLTTPTIVRGATEQGGHAKGDAASAADHPPILDGLGTHSHPVTTPRPEAQRYFDQGLRLVYAFNHDEAIRAFRHAARLDPDCAMAWWGVAFAAGPNYNLPIDEERDRVAREAMDK